VLVTKGLTILGTGNSTSSRQPRDHNYDGLNTFRRHPEQAHDGSTTDVDGVVSDHQRHILQRSALGVVESSERFWASPTRKPPASSGEPLTPLHLIKYTYAGTPISTAISPQRYFLSTPATSGAASGWAHGLRLHNKVDGATILDR